MIFECLGNYLKTTNRLSCVRFAQFDKLMVGFQIKINSLWVMSPNNKELTQSISNRDDSSNVAFEWILDDGTSDKAFCGHSYYFKKGDLLALFIGDDNIKHAFRNDVHIATGSIGTSKFFEEKFGFVDNVTRRGGGVEVVSD